MTLNPTLRSMVPPSLRRSIKRTFRDYFKRTIEWEYLPEGWRSAQLDRDIKGWNVTDICETYKVKWPIYINYLEGTGPLGIAHESDLKTNTDISFHNTVMSYSYALTLASRMKSTISMLDWGGGIGHYYPLSQALVPDLQIEYHCKDMAVFQEYAKSLFPDAHFYTDEACLDRQYDFVLVSSSLQYVQDWERLLQKLSQATNGYIYITRMPFVENAAPFAFVQRPYFYGYNTEYIGWCLNRTLFLEAARNAGLRLVREFVTGEAPYIDGAPEQNRYLGFLFQHGTTTAEIQHRHV